MKSQHLDHKTVWVLTSATILVSLVCWFLCHALASHGKGEAERSLLAVAIAGAAAIESEAVASLAGGPEDLETARYETIRRKLVQIREANRDARFVYLMAIRDDKVVFLVDAEPADSKDHSAPGDVYDEASPQLIEAFVAGQPFVEGPFEDRWGEWVSGHAPIRNIETDETVALIGLDLDARHWRSTVLMYCWFGLSLTVVPLVLAALVFVYLWRTRRANAVLAGEIQERKQTQKELESHRNHLEELVEERAGELARTNFKLENEILVREATDQVLRIITEGTSYSTGEEYLKDIARYMTTALGFRWGLVGEIRGSERDKAETRAVWSSENVPERLLSRLDGVLCQEVLSGEPLLFQGDMKDHFSDGATLLKMGVRTYLGLPVHNSIGTLVGVLILLHDGPVEFPLDIETITTTFTERIATELERQRFDEAHQRLATAIEQAAEAIVITDTQGLIEYVNPAFERTTGYSCVEAIGQNPRVLKSGEHDEVHYRDLWDTITDGRVWTGRFINKRKDGVLFEEEATISPITSSSNRITGFVGVKRDVTHERDIENRLIQAQKMEALGTLAGGIAHDFNNVLAAVLGFADLSLAEVPEDSSVHYSLLQIQEAGRRAANLVDQILTFSRQSEQDHRPFHSQPIVEEALKLIRSSLPSTIEIREKIDTKSDLILADSTQIHQVVMNLCTNAYHAMRETGGVLDVSLETVDLSPKDVRAQPELRAGEHVCLIVRDTGHGMDKATIERIIEPYFTTKEQGEGTGLGLATVHGIVTGLSGDIQVESTPGEGTTFTILLPCYNGTQDDEGGGETQEPLPPGKERILLVDDEESLLEAVGRFLEKLGYDVDAIESSKEALWVFQADPDAFDLVITDQTMPQLTGFELSRHILEIRPDMPIILCTGYSEIVDRENARKVGIRDYLEKPVLPRDFSRTIRGILDSRILAETTVTA